ncbi:NADP-dependent oxidoreductase [Hyphomonas sp. UBA4494]|uniref:NADP-dependent oxidoreductase n=1 Tax=Hyphomonas sp. UBA4494 TaxID=1946631 RepID=UPI0025B867E4|nr:NADP-dependent oxidoreductase [Hyphomonas sp. UBA4494]
MTALTSTEWSLAARPVGMPKFSDFQMKTIDIAPPGAGEIQVKNEWMSVDPYMRGRMQDRESYVPPFQIGETMQGGAVGRVTVSNHPDYKEGDLVSSMAGWRTAWVGKPEMAMAQKLPEVGLPESAFLGVAGMPGLTAYAGLLRVAELKEGDTVFVSGAAGAVGSTVVQIAKIKGCTVIGSAGGKEKCDVVKSLGADHVIDYKAAGGFDGLVKALREAAPKGIDVYFDNVGGDHLTAAIEVARPMARFAECGMIAQYNETGQPTGPHNVIQIVGKQLKIQGFIVSTHADMQPDFFKDMAKWIPSGQMKYEETVKEGIEKAPEAFIGLFEGANTGKMLVKLG